MELIKEDRSFLVALGWGLLALLLSAVIFLAMSFAYVTAKAPGGATNTYSKTVPGAQLKSRMGTSKVTGEGIKLTGFKTHDNQQHALISLKTTFRAENYPFLSYQFEGWHTGMRINFIWRTASNPRGLSTTILNRSLDDPGTLNLAKEPNWQGTVTEIGLHFVGETRDEPLIIPELTFQPYSWTSMAAAVWSEWTAFRGWSGTSINYLTGVPGQPATATLSPSMAMGTWTFLAVLVLLAVGAVRGKRQLSSYGAVIVIPWMALDLLWQDELDTQLVETKTVFGGKTIHEKHLADSDRHIYEYAQRLKKEHLPASSTRIFVLHKSDGHNYDRLKTQYYLLPHNIFNYGSTPPPEAVRPGDYILALGDLPGLAFLPNENLLAWPDNIQLDVKLVDSDPMGNLYVAFPPTADVPGIDIEYAGGSDYD